MNVHKLSARVPTSSRGAMPARLGPALVAGFYRWLRRRDEEFVPRPVPSVFRSLVHNAPDVVLVTSADGKICYANAAVSRVLGYRPGELVGEWVWEYLSSTQAERVLAAAKTGGRRGSGFATSVEMHMRHADYSWRPVVVSVAELSNGWRSQEHIAYYIRDVSDHKAERERLVNQASKDCLTGLANRTLFISRLERALLNGSRRQSSVAVLFLDLDNFKTVNDGYGHVIGDLLLGVMGQRLQSCIRPTDCAARLGGDEFVILVEEAAGTSPPTRLAERLLNTLEEPVALEGHVLSVTVSIGVAVSSPDLCNARELLRAADAAMYTAKFAGKGHYAVYREGTPMRHFAGGALDRRADSESRWFPSV